MREGPLLICHLSSSHLSSIHNRLNTQHIYQTEALCSTKMTACDLYHRCPSHYQILLRSVWKLNIPKLSSMSSSISIQYFSFLSHVYSTCVKKLNQDVPINLAMQH